MFRRLWWPVKAWLAKRYKGQAVDYFFCPYCQYQHYIGLSGSGDHMVDGLLKFQELSKKHLLDHAGEWWPDGEPWIGVRTDYIQGEWQVIETVTFNSEDEIGPLCSTQGWTIVWPHSVDLASSAAYRAAELHVAPYHYLPNAWTPHDFKSYLIEIGYEGTEGSYGA